MKVLLGILIVAMILQYSGKAQAFFQNLSSNPASGLLILFLCLLSIPGVFVIYRVYSR